MAQEGGIRQRIPAWSAHQQVDHDARTDTAVREWRRSPYSRQVAGILSAATTLSIIHTIHTALTIAPEYGKDPVLYLLYAILWGLVALAWTDRRGAWWTIGATLTLLIGIGIFYYPTIFVPAWQTPFGWFENDVYMGLLILAAYLTIQRLRGISLSPGR